MLGDLSGFMQSEWAKGANGDGLLLFAARGITEDEALPARWVKPET